MHFGIKLPRKLRYVVILAPLCAVIIGLSLLIIRADLHRPWDNTLDNLNLFLSKGLDPSKVDFGEIAPAFEEIRIWLAERRQSEGFFRTVWLPSERVLLNKLLFRYDIPTLKAQSELDHMMLVLLPLLRGETKDFGKLLAYYNVKYTIVYLKTFTSSEPWQEYYEGNPRLLLQIPYGFAAAGAPGEYIKLLDKQNDLKLVVDKPEYRIYENLDFTIPHISAYNRIFLVAPPDITIGFPLEGEEYAQNVLRNSGFEEGLSPWSGAGIKDTNYSIDNATSYSGQSCLRMELDDEGDNTVYQSIEIRENLRYRMTAWVKSKNAHMIQFKAYFTDNAGNTIKPGGADSLQMNLWINPDEDWAWVSWIIKPPPGAANMRVELALIWWMKDDENQPATVWLDDVTVRVWEYFTGSALSVERIPPQYMHGQMLATIPGLLSKIPNLNPSQHLLVPGLFLPYDEAREEYLKLADAVIFLGDVDKSEAAKKWTEEPETLLFVHEAELSFRFTPSEPPEETAPIEIADDNQAEFWRGGGSIGAAQLSNEAVEKTKGNDSLKISVGSGEGARWWLQHMYDTPQDWSEKDLISLYWYGGNSGATLRLIAATNITTPNAFAAYFKDDFTGWKRIVLPFSSFERWGEPDWENIDFLEIEVNEPNVIGTWYLDRVVADVNAPVPTATVISSTTAGTPLSHEHALSIDGEGKLAKQFFTPRASYFRVMIRAGVDGEMSLKINDQPLNITDIYEGEGSFKWYESSPIYLETGDHTLSIDFKSNEATFDQILLFSTKHEDTTFKDIFATDPIEISWVEEKPARYSVRVNSNEPTLIVLGEAYHEEWKAHTDDGENLKHIPAFPLGWANGFYLPQGGEKQVKIVFGMQETKDIAIRIWIVAWGCLVAGITGSWVLYYRRRFKR